MVRHDVAGTLRQEQIVQYIQHINPVHALIPLYMQHTIQLHIGLNINSWERGLYSRPVKLKDIGQIL